MMRRFLTALGFLTIFPSPAHSDFEENELGRSMSLFPLVGLLLGCILFVINYILSSFFSDGLVNIILIASLALLTGGLHLDGFMDTLDGFGGGNNREKVLAIMRDSHAGAFGVIGIVILLFIKLEALNSFGAEMKGTALILMPVISRWGMALLARISPYARAEGLGRPFSEGLKDDGIVIASVITIVISFILSGMGGLLIMIIVGGFCLLWSRWSIKRIGGVTGDIIGAFNELAALLVLLIFLIL